MGCWQGGGVTGLTLAVVVAWVCVCQVSAIQLERKDRVDLILRDKYMAADFERLG